MRRAALAAFGLWAITGCGDQVQCAAPLAASCAPLYEPTFDNVFNRTLLPTCGQAGGSCHAVEGAQAGVVFAEQSESHRQLVDAARGLVLPGDARCGVLVTRLETDNPAASMPPGQQLDTAERCAIRRWIQAGAQP